MSYYAVKLGRNRGIFFTWDECKKQIDGYPSAKYKKFETLEAAADYAYPRNYKLSKISK